MPINTKMANSFFETDTWLDLVAGDKWERLFIYKNDGSVEAVFPIVKKRKYGCKVLTNPDFTQTLGYYYKDTGAKITKKLEREKRIVNGIIDNLPKGFSYDFYLDVDNRYILPFIWKGFSIEPCFTYRLEDISNLENVWKGLKENIRTDIRKAENKVVINYDCDPNTLVKLQEKVFHRQGRKLPYEPEVIRSICKTLKENDALDLLSAVDSEGNVHAAVLLVYDDNRCYYLMSGGDPKYRNSGATSLLLWKGINRAAERGVHIFDFEGSMIEDIERFVRAFGASPCTYYHVMKYKPIYKFMIILKKRVKKARSF